MKFDIEFVSKKTKQNKIKYTIQTMETETT